MTTQAIDATLLASSHPDLAKRTSVPAFIFSTVLLLVGILSFVSVFELSDKTSAVSMALMVGGTVLILVGLLRMVWKSKEMVYLPTGSATKERTLFFDLKNLSKLTDVLEHRHLNSDLTVKSDGNGNVRMDVMMSQDKKFVAVQLFQFVPYTYTPVTNVCYFTGSEAAAVCAFLARC